MDKGTGQGPAGEGETQSQDPQLSFGTKEQELNGEVSVLAIISGSGIWTKSLPCYK